MTDPWRNPHSDLSADLCTLKYRSSRSCLETTDGAVVLLAIRQAAGLKLYVAPNLEQQISTADWPYVDELLKDLADRAATAPDAVFQQLSNLSIGPLVTAEVKHTTAQDADPCTRFSHFLPCGS